MIVFPNAKVNIGLFVTGKRQDGFHNLETVFYPIGLSDILEIEGVEGKGGMCSLTQTGIDVECEAEKNLVVRAYGLLATDFDLPSMRVHLHKVIPFGAGLGGGSSDGAFMLKAINDYFDLKISAERLEEYSARLGSDCAFFVRNRPAFASGKGERLEEIGLSLEDYHWVVVKPSFGISTADAYSGIVPKAAGFDLRRLASVPVEQWKEVVGNDFEANVFAKHPQLGALKQRLYDAGAVFVSMTGSGSGIYGLFKKGQQVNLSCPDCWVWQND